MLYKAMLAFDSVEGNQLSVTIPNQITSYIRIHVPYKLMSLGSWKPLIGHYGHVVAGITPLIYQINIETQSQSISREYQGPQGNHLF